MSPLSDVQNAWVVDAMIASYNHVYKVEYDTKYEELGAVSASDYGSAPVASYQVEFNALDANPDAVIRTLEKYAINGRRYVLNAFHQEPSGRDLKMAYAQRGYEIIRTGPIFGLEIPTVVRRETPYIKRLETSVELNEANEALTLEGQKIHPAAIKDANIHNFAAYVNDQFAGWVQLVTAHARSGYIHNIYTLKKFRNQRVGYSLMIRAHAECAMSGRPYMALVSSDSALGLYRRLGYRPLVYFTAFRPRGSSQEVTIRF